MKKNFCTRLHELKKPLKSELRAELDFMLTYYRALRETIKVAANGGPIHSISSGGKMKPFAFK